MIFSIWYAPFVVAQTSNPISDWGDIVKVYGLAAPFLLFLLYVIWEQRKDINKRDEKLEELTDAMIDKVMPLVTESQSVLKDAAEAIKKSQDITSSVLTTNQRLENSVTRLEAISSRWER